jgi:ribosomal protein S18 acetylase RimI-like enzyme
MKDNDLLWRAERACLDAWPAETEAAQLGWLLRHSGGPTRRPNSLNPTRSAAHECGALIDAADAFYTARGQRPIFRLPKIGPDIGKELDKAGYGGEEGWSLTLLAEEITVPPDTPCHKVSLSPAPSQDWIASRHTLSGTLPEDQPFYNRMLTLIRGPVCFAALEVESVPCAQAYGTIQQGLLVLESVVTDATCRNKGYGRAVVGALLGWGKQAGAQAACLQVVADNDPALALYARLGFSKTLYGYHYRRKENAPAQ